MQKSFIYLCFSLFLFFTQAAFSDELIIEPDRGREPIIDLVNSTQHSLDLIMYGFTDEPIFDAILKQSEAGNTVKVLLERSPYKTENENQKIMERLKRHHIPLLGSVPPFRLIHQKTLIIDDKKALIMTFNFTKSTFKQQRNFGLVIDDPQTVKAIAAIFAADWNHIPAINSSPDVVISPNDSRKKIMVLLQQAHQSILIYAQTLNDYQLIDILGKMARKGVQVNVITSGKIREKQELFLVRSGVKIHQSKKLYIHAKVFIIDNQKALIGSINLTRASLNDNRELAVITRDSTVIKQLNETFNKDWKETDDAAIGDIKALFHDKRNIKKALRLLERYLN